MDETSQKTQETPQNLPIQTVPVPTSEQISQFLGENPTILSQFQENLKPQTQASPALSEGVDDLGLVRLNPKDIEKFLWMHPVIPRGIEIKANRMTSRGFKFAPFDSSSEAIKAAESMKTLVENSGGEILINGWIQDGYGFGNGYLTLLPDSDSGEISYLSKEHPVYFRIAREKKKGKRKFNYPTQNQSDFGPDYGPMKIDPATKQPLAYTQIIYKNDSQVEPIGKELRPDQVAHLVFDTWGDEAEGISYVQYVHQILKYLMNIEDAGAEAIYRSGFTQKKVTTDITNEKELKKIARNLKDINSADSIILPKGTDVENLVPGTSEFVSLHDVLLNLVAMRIGVPKPILTLDGTDINKACYSEDTQVLTNVGWKFYTELTGKEKVAQYNLEKDRIEFVDTDGKIYVYNYNGKMKNFVSDRMNILVTPDHRMLVSENGREYTIQKARELTKNIRYRFKNGSQWVGEEQEKMLLPQVYRYPELNIDMDDWLEFVGYMISEGGLLKRKTDKKEPYIFTIAQKEDNHPEIVKFLHYFNDKYNIHSSYYFDNKTNAHRFSYSNKQLWLALSEYGIGAENKRISKNILSLSTRQLNILYDALMAGDGSKQKNSYSTVSKELCDDFLELCLKTNKVASFSVYKDKRLLKIGSVRKPLYRLSITNNLETVFVRNNIKDVNYNGKVWCVSVPSGVFVTRRNGKVAIQGNTMDELMKDMIHDIHADEIKVRRTIEDQIFKPACLSIFGEGFEKFPKFIFNDFVEGKEEKALILKDTATYLSVLTDAFLKLKQSGETETATKFLEFINHNIPSINLDTTIEEEAVVVKNEESRSKPVARVEPTPQTTVPTVPSPGTGDNPA
jgi:hypothetical protein